MESEIAENEMKRVHRAFMGRIARALLPEGGGIDRRDALVLMDCDVISADPPVDSEDSIKGLRLAVAVPAAKASLGPLLFYIKDSGGRSVVRVRDLLLDGRPEIRAIAVAHLENTFALPGLSTRRTRQELERLRPALLASDGGGWRRAAIDLVDAVDEDWLLGIAGVRQAQSPALQEVWSEYVTMVLRPSLASVNACWPPILCAGLHAESMDQQAKAWQTEGGSSLALYAAYLEAVGHLPLGGRRSLSGVLSMINGGAPSEAVVAELLDWATNDGRPFSRYHACEAVMSAGAGLATRDQSRAAVWFWETVLAPRDCVGAKGGCAAESLVAQLARYYLHYLEVRLPSDHGEAIAAMAWWMAMRMMTVIENGAARQRAFGEQLARVYGSIASDIWDLVAPPTSPSVLHYLTAFGPSPWALSLLATVATEEDAQRLLTSPGPGTLDERVHALIAIAMQVANLGLNEDHNLYRMSDGARRMLGWIASHEPDEARQAILKGWSEPIDWTPPDSLTKALEGVEQKDVHVQRWLCHAIRQRVSVGALAGDDLWGIVSSDVWKKSTWQNIDRLAAQALGCALVDDAARRRPEWAPHLVHLFTETAEQRAGNEEDRQAFFGLVLRGSCALNASSAICRLLRGRAGHRFRPLATVTRGNLEQVLPQAGGWAAGRLRAVLVDLAH